VYAHFVASSRSLLQQVVPALLLQQQLEQRAEQDETFVFVF
jgi:hypothetical protein